jgi:general secretion pathway protein H
MREAKAHAKSLSAFTLIEVLIVLVIIGITLTFTLLAFGDFGQSRQIVYASESLKNNIELCKQLAIIQNATFGIQFNGGVSYQILQANEDAIFKEKPGKRLFAVHYFPKNMYLNIQNIQKHLPNTPQIIINPEGTITPFTLQFGTSKESLVIKLSLNKDGRVVSINEGNNQ